MIGAIAAAAVAGLLLFAGPARAAGDPVYLAWPQDPATTLTVVWRTPASGVPSQVEYRATGEVAWQTATGGVRPSGTAGVLHEVTLGSLAPGTAYEYRVRTAAATWGQVRSARTAPPPGPADFDAVFVADTGIAGRLDGLATGTQAVIDAIAAQHPLLVLLGGDYAYYNTDTRFDTQDEAMDAWFEQMLPISGRAPLMPVYGNHEVLLGESLTLWQQRFPTPPGFDGRRNYSFDVGDVHFVALFAVQNTDPLPSATLQWLQADLAAARAAGQRWLVPFFHVSPFTDGTNHPSNLNMRAQLVPLFAQAGVDLVLSAHDQAFERSFALEGAPPQPTSDARRCYAKGEGTTWLKSSPGGKLSNISGGFSPFASDPAPAWTAARSNTRHSFARLRVSASGVLRAEAWAVRGDGTPPVLEDFFEIVDGECPPELGFEPEALELDAEPGRIALANVELGTIDGSPAPTSLSSGAPWLFAAPAAGSPGAVSVVASARYLEPGSYEAAIGASAPGTIDAELPVLFRVGGGHGLRMSGAPDRSAARVLAGRAVAGEVYIFVSPEQGAEDVEFYIDDPDRSGPPAKVEGNPPWDLAGTANTAGRPALPFDTHELSDGEHVVSALVVRSDGSERQVDAVFRVANTGTPGACRNGVDDDGDGRVDFPLDAGCWDALSPREDPQCSDSVDNDGDGSVDWNGGLAGEAADPVCAGDASRNREGQSRCGLGVELAPLLVALAALRRRRHPRSR